MHSWVVDDCRFLIDALEMRISGLEAEIRHQAKPDKRVDALMEVPGIGLLSAMTLVAEIGDMSRFAKARKLCAWARLIPSMRNSDRTVHHGHITKAGPAAVRHVLGEAAHVAALSRALRFGLHCHQGTPWDRDRPCAHILLRPQLPRGRRIVSSVRSPGESVFSLAPERRPLT